MLFPENWMGWYAPQGVVNPDGHSLHYWHLPRFGFFIALSAPVTGAWLYAYRRYLQASAQPDAAYLAWLLPLAQKLMLVGGVVAVLLGAVWMATSGLSDHRGLASRTDRGHLQPQRGAEPGG
jgi:hypothetical protein